MSPAERVQDGQETAAHHAWHGSRQPVEKKAQGDLMVALGGTKQEATRTSCNTGNSN